MARTASRTVRLALVAAALGVACVPPDSSAFGLPEAATEDAVDAGARDTGSFLHDASTPGADATAPGHEAGEPEASTADAPAESTAADGTTEDAHDGGSADTGTDAATSDAPVCTAGPAPDYQASCTGCSIGATCVLACTSCTTKAQTQNPNPSLQLPCAGTESVQNEDGALTCQ
jgi:hypothetical protein